MDEKMHNLAFWPSKLYRPTCHTDVPGDQSTLFADAIMSDCHILSWMKKLSLYVDSVTIWTYKVHEHVYPYVCYHKLFLMTFVVGKPA